MHKIIFSKKAEREFLKLDRPVQRRIVAVLERIRVRPGRYLTRLSGLPYYKLRVGDYRLIIDLQDDVMIVYVIKVANRRNVYKRRK